MRITSALLTSLPLCTLALAANPSPTDWPAWRGPNFTGAVAQSNPPIEWSESKNMRWKTPIPGLGHASPIIHGERVIVLTAAPVDGAGSVLRFLVMSIDRKTGKTVWQRAVCEQTPHERGHQDASQASASPVTDGEVIVAHYGSRGVYGVSWDGEVLWNVELGQMRTRNEFGEGASPALHGDTVVIQWDHEGDDFILALDRKTGKEIWRVKRDEPTSWSTPLIVPGTPTQVIANGRNAIRSYDLATGKELWHTSGMTMNVIPTPVLHDGVAIMMSGFRGNAIRAVRLADAKGEAPESAIVWKSDAPGTPYVPSPLLLEGKLYFTEHNKAMLSCLDAATGQVHYTKQRIEGLTNIYAAPVGVPGRLYIVGRDGQTAVIQAGAEYKLLGVNELDDGFDASPAIAGDELYLRGRKHLYCIGS
jgi:outer membrane protein assembly factor BamB